MRVAPADSPWIVCAPCGTVGVALQPLQIQRPARFRTGAGLAFAAERLHADHGADDVAVDVDIADMRVRRDEIDRLVDARMNAERQAVAGRVDRIDQLRQLVAP